jgi:hypothetical protein
MQTLLENTNEGCQMTSMGFHHQYRLLDTQNRRIVMRSSIFTTSAKKIRWLESRCDTTSMPMLCGRPIECGQTIPSRRGRH